MTAYALDKGLQVRLLYCSETTECVPECVKKNVKVENLGDCKKVLENVDGVCFILGTRNQLGAAPAAELFNGTANIIEAMKEKNLKRLSIGMSTFLFRPIAEVPPMFHRLNEEHQRMLDLTKASGLDFIAILPPHIAEE